MAAINGRNFDVAIHEFTEYTIMSLYIRARMLEMHEISVHISQTREGCEMWTETYGDYEALVPMAEYALIMANQMVGTSFTNEQLLASIGGER